MRSQTLQTGRSLGVGGPAAAGLRSRLLAARELLAGLDEMNRCVDGARAFADGTHLPRVRLTALEEAITVEFRHEGRDYTTVEFTCQVYSVRTGPDISIALEARPW